jgi:hypothetical protein
LLWSSPTDQATAMVCMCSVIVKVNSVLHCGVLGGLAVGRGHIIVKSDWKVKLSTAPFHLYCSDFKSLSEKLCVVVQMYELRFFSKKRIKIFHHSLDHGASCVNFIRCV